jgi:tRNA (cmo5U34)-methyltransferase
MFATPALPPTPVGCRASAAASSDISNPAAAAFFSCKIALNRLYSINPALGMRRCEMADHDTLCGWGDKAKVSYFVANADIIVPRREEQMNLLVQLLPQTSNSAFSILDLGAGFGAVTERLLEHYPRATATCVDGSDAMVVHARERLRKFDDRVRIRKADLVEASWRTDLSGPFDAVVSAIAIHHVTNERKRELYREVFQLLTQGGVFLNNDVVATPPAMKERFETLNLVAIQEQERQRRGSSRTLEQIQTEMREQLRLVGGRHHSQIAPLIDQLGWLAEAGFGSVDCYWRYLDLAIFGGVKE